MNINIANFIREHFFYKDLGNPQIYLSSKLAMMHLCESDRIVMYELYPFICEATVRIPLLSVLSTIRILDDDTRLLSAEIPYIYFKSDEEIKKFDTLCEIFDISKTFHPDDPETISIYLSNINRYKQSRDCGSGIKRDPTFSPAEMTHHGYLELLNTPIIGINENKKSLAALKVCILGNISDIQMIVKIGSNLFEQDYDPKTIFTFSGIDAIYHDKEKSSFTILKLKMSDIIYVVNRSKWVDDWNLINIKCAKEMGKAIIYSYEDPDRLFQHTVPVELKSMTDWMKTFGMKKVEKNDTVPNPERLEIVTLCGSRKFVNEMNLISNFMTLQGKIVLKPAIFDFEKFTVDLFDNETHNKLDKIHRAKMDMSDLIYVVNVGGYIGENTREEIEYAKSKGMKISYTVDPETGKENQL